MAKGPRGEKRPTNPFEAGVMVGRIATGEIVDNTKNEAAAALGRKGGASRAKKLTPTQRRRIAKKAAKVRWGLD
jgi:hypothetical protein